RLHTLASYGLRNSSTPGKQTLSGNCDCSPCAVGHRFSRVGRLNVETVTIRRIRVLGKRWNCGVMSRLRARAGTLDNERAGLFSSEFSLEPEGVEGTDLVVDLLRQVFGMLAI